MVTCAFCVHHLSFTIHFWFFVILFAHKTRRREKKKTKNNFTSDIVYGFLLQQFIWTKNSTIRCFGTTICTAGRLCGLDSHLYFTSFNKKIKKKNKFINANRVEHQRRELNALSLFHRFKLYHNEYLSVGLHAVITEHTHTRYSQRKVLSSNDALHF